MNNYREDPQAKSRLLQLPAEIRNTIYDHVSLTTSHVRLMGTRLQRTVTDDAIEVTLVVKTLPTALMCACQILRREVGTYKALQERLVQEPPRVIVDTGDNYRAKDEEKQLDVNVHGMSWTLTEAQNAGWAYATSKLISGRENLPKIKKSTLLGMEFRDEKQAALARQFIYNLGEYIAWRCGYDKKKVDTKNIGPGSLFHVAIEAFDTNRPRDDGSLLNIARLAIGTIRSQGPRSFFQVATEAFETIRSRDVPPRDEYLDDILPGALTKHSQGVGRWYALKGYLLDIHVISRDAGKNFTVYIVHSEDVDELDAAKIHDIYPKGEEAEILGLLGWKKDWEQSR